VLEKIFNPLNTLIMKRFFFLSASDRAVVATLVSIIAIASMVLFFTSCSTEEPSLPPSEPSEATVHLKSDTTKMESVTITFNCRGDFNLQTQPFGTRSLTADGKAMTDLWVLDYPDGATAPTIQLHQVSEGDTRIRLVLHAELNMMMRMMIGKKLQGGLDQAVEGLAKAFNQI
jgi:hypothetical protein